MARVAPGVTVIPDPLGVPMLGSLAADTLLTMVKEAARGARAGRFLLSLCMGPPSSRIKLEQDLLQSQA